MKIIVSGKHITKKQNKRLQEMGLFKKAPNLYITEIIDNKTIDRVKKYSLKHHLNFRIDNDYGLRSHDYRKKYIQKNPPQNNKYRCVYCGRKFPIEKIQIDHLYPVAKVSKSIKLQQQLKRKGIESINDISNLVTACSFCNNVKSDKLGLWIIRGKIGQTEWLWKVRWGIRGMLILLVIIIILTLFIPELNILLF